jgi:hypothetical protein
MVFHRSAYHAMDYPKNQHSFRGLRRRPAAPLGVSRKLQFERCAAPLPRGVLIAPPGASGPAELRRAQAPSPTLAQIGPRVQTAVSRLSHPPVLDPIELPVRARSSPTRTSRGAHLSLPFLRLLANAERPPPPAHSGRAEKTAPLESSAPRLPAETSKLTSPGWGGRPGTPSGDRHR